MQVLCVVLGGGFRFGLQSVVVGLLLERARDALDLLGELLRGLCCVLLDISLEDQEVPGLDQDAVLLKGLVVLLGGNLAAVDAVLALAGGGDGALPFVLLLGVVLVDGLHPGGLGVVCLGAGLGVAILRRLGVAVGCASRIALGRSAVSVDAGFANDPAAVDQILQLVGAQLSGADAEDEGDGVHTVRLAGAIGTDDGGEVRVGEEQRVAPTVGLEVCAGQVSVCRAKQLGAGALYCKLQGAPASP